MTEYLLSVNHVEGDDVPSSEAMEKMYADVGAFNAKLRESGSWVFAGGLMPRETATTVDNSGEEAVVTDGPFAETKEWLGGVWIIDVPDLDVALRWATEGSRACGGPVEVRPFQAM